MPVDGIDAQAHQLDAALVEFRLQLRESAEFGRANRREILRVREQKRPAIADPIVEFDCSFGGLGFEIGGGCANLECHGWTSSYSSCREIRLGDYRSLKRVSEPVRAKGEILLRKPGTPSIFFCSAPLRRKNSRLPHSTGLREFLAFILLFDRNLFKAVPLFCPLCPDIAFYRPHHAGPLCTPKCPGKAPWPEL